MRAVGTPLGWRARQGLVIAAALCAGAAIGRRADRARPVFVPIATRAVPAPPIEAAFARWEADRDDPAARVALVQACERAAEVALRAEPGLGMDGLVDRLRGLTGIAGDRIDGVELRAGERLVTWCFGTRGMALDNACIGASVFRDAGTGWSAIGRSLHDVWGLAIEGVDAESGIAYLSERYVGNGAPPAQVIALAVVAGRVVTVTSGLVADTREAGPSGVVIQRRVAGLDDYPSEPIVAARWWVEREGDGLVTHARSLTPWIDALVEACAGGDAATAEVRSALLRCGHVDRVSSRADGAVEVAMSATVQGPGVEEPGEDRDIVLELRQDGGRWRATSLHP